MHLTLDKLAAPVKCVAVIGAIVRLLHNVVVKQAGRSQYILAVVINTIAQPLRTVTLRPAILAEAVPPERENLNQIRSLSQKFLLGRRDKARNPCEKNTFPY